MKLYQVTKIRGLDEKETIVHATPCHFWFYQELKRMREEGYFNEVVENGNVGYEIDWGACGAIRRILDRLAIKDRFMKFPAVDVMGMYDNRVERTIGYSAMEEVFHQLQFWNAINRLFAGTDGDMHCVKIFFIDGERVSDAILKLKSPTAPATEEPADFTE